MTGQGAATRSDDSNSVVVEVRSVNSRFLKLNMSSSERLLPLQAKIEALVRRYVQRGTVYLNLRVLNQSYSSPFRINSAVLQSYREQLGEMDGARQTVSLDALLSLPGVIEEVVVASDGDEAEWTMIEGAVEEALKKLNDMRALEGAAMADDLLDNIGQVGKFVDAISQLAPGVSESYAGRLTTRINKMLEEHDISVSPSDLIREVGIFSERCDISEEIVRLKSHLDQFRTIVAGEKSNGRKLDFLTQELLRETNTIGSKAGDSEIARNVVEIKSAIERIREMVQNVE